MKISIIVPAFNEEKLIANTLQNLRAVISPFTRRNWQAELIVCDNNSTDRTAELAREAGAVVVFEPVNQIGRARNRGASAATGDWLIFVDADSLPSVELFEDVMREIESGNCLAGGSTIKLDEFILIPALVTGVWNLTSRFRRWFAGSFIFCDAPAFQSVGGFNNEFFVGEELDLSKRLNKLARANGKRVVILRNHPLLTSARKLRLYSRREHLRFMVRMVFSGGRNIKRRDACFPWYDGRR